MAKLRELWAVSKCFDCRGGEKTIKLGVGTWPSDEDVHFTQFELATVRQFRFLLATTLPDRFHSPLTVVFASKPYFLWSLHG